MSQQKGVFSQPSYAAAPNGISKTGESIFLTGMAPLKQWGTLLPDGVCLKSREQRADLAPGFISSRSEGGLWGRARDVVPAGVWQSRLLPSVPPGPGAHARSIVPGHYGRSQEE